MIKKLIFKLVFLAVGFVFCASFAFAASLERADTLYLQGSFADSIDECASLINQNNNVDYAYYLLGLNYLKLNDVEKSREKLDYLFANFKDSPFMDSGKLAYTDTFFIEQNYPKAKEGYESILKPESHVESTLYLRLIQCALKSGNWQEAKNYLGAVKQKYPQSMEALQAEGLVGDEEFFFTVQVGCFASLSNAQKLLDKLKNQNFDAYIDELDSNDGKLYRVRVGRLSERKEAEELKSLLDKENYPTRIFP